MVIWNITKKNLTSLFLTFAENIVKIRSQFKKVILLTDRQTNAGKSVTSRVEATGWSWWQRRRRREKTASCVAAAASALTVGEERLNWSVLLCFLLLIPFCSNQHSLFSLFEKKKKKRKIILPESKEAVQKKRPLLCIILKKKGDEMNEWVSQQHRSLLPRLFFFFYPQKSGSPSHSPPGGESLSIFVPVFSLHPSLLQLKRWSRVWLCMFLNLENKCHTVLWVPDSDLMT